jgi:zinc protease
MLIASSAVADPKVDVTHFELANGMRVLVVEDHRAPIAYEVMWVRAGSKDEVSGHTGFAHLFEHLMFKGSTHLPDGTLDRLLEEAGGWSNGATSLDETVYEDVTASAYLETAMWIDADRLAGLTDTLDQPKLDNQRDVVLNERHESEDNVPYGDASELVEAALWPKDHGYHWDTLGDPKDLAAASLADVRAFFATYYVPNNITLVVAGDVHADDVQRLAKRYFEWIPRGGEPKRPRYATPAPITKQITLAKTEDVQAPAVYVAWRAPAAYGADEPAVALAAAILGRGKASRLYKRLVYDDKVAQDITTGASGYQLGGEVEIEVTVKPGVDPDKIIAAISDEVARLAKTAPDAAELERAVHARELTLLGNLESTLARAHQIAEYDTFAHDPDYLGKDLARFRAVSPAQVQAAAAAYLKPTARVVLTIKPGKKP